VAYSIEHTAAALRDLQALPPDILRRVDVRILTLAEHPRPRGNETVPGSQGLRRLRVGAYRIIYRVDDANQVVTIARVPHRRDVYRGL
jgi:mRNA interferase RelE/StbE